MIVFTCSFKCSASDFGKEKGRGKGACSVGQQILTLKRC